MQKSRGTREKWSNLQYGPIQHRVLFMAQAPGVTYSRSILEGNSGIFPKFWLENEMKMRAKTRVLAGFKEINEQYNSGFLENRVIHHLMFLHILQMLSNSAKSQSGSI